MSRFVAGFAALIAAAALAACSTPPIAPVGPNAFVVKKTDYKGIFYDAAGLLAAAKKDSDEFAARQGKLAEMTNLVEIPNIPSKQFYRIEYEFRLVDDPATMRRQAATPPPSTATAPQQAPSGKPDLYTELIKLDELRKRGLLTDAEFEVRKKKLLETL